MSGIDVTRKHLSTAALARRISADAKALDRREAADERCGTFCVELERAIYDGRVSLPGDWYVSLNWALRDPVDGAVVGGDGDE